MLPQQKRPVWFARRDVFIEEINLYEVLANSKKILIFERAG